METKDYIVRATAANDSVRIFAMTSTGIVEEARRLHSTSNVVTAALGRLLTAGALMGSMQKNSTDVLTLQVEGSGPIGGLTVTSGIGEAESGGETHELVYVKGYPKNPVVEIPLKPSGKLDVGNAVGKGYLTVIKDMGLKEPFSGQTELVSGEIAEDLTYYFVNSEQVPSSVALGVLVEPGGSVICAGGFIIQLLPFAEDEVIDRLEAKLANIDPVTTSLASGKTPEQIAEDIFGDMGLKIVDRIPAMFYCDCSRERVRRAVMSIDAADIREMIADSRPIEVDCQFCRTKYVFDIDELETILAEKSKKKF